LSEEVLNEKEEKTVTTNTPEKCSHWNYSQNKI